MNEHAHIDSKALIREITRYLAAVDAFRAERSEPTWLPEPRPVADLMLPHVGAMYEFSEPPVH